MNKIVLNMLSENLYPISLYCRQIAGTVILLFLTRFLSIHDYGVFTSYKAQATFCLLFTNLGFNEYILVSSQKNIREVKLKIGLFILNAICTTIALSFLTIFFKLESRYIFILVLARTFLDGVFFSLALPYFQAAKKFATISYVNMFYSIALVLLAIIAFLLKFSLVKFLWCSIILGVINFLQVSVYARINYLMVLVHIKDVIKKIDKSIFAYIGVVVCSYLYSQLPSLYSSIFLAKEEAALYFAAFTIASVIMVAIVAQVQKIIPEMIQTSVSSIKNVLKRNLIIMNSINIVIFILFLFTGKFILNILYGNAYYNNAYLILLALTLSNISIATASIYGAYITASGNQKIKIKMQIEAIVVTILCLLIFYRLKVYAAVIAYFLSTTLIGVRYVLKARKLLKANS